MTTIAASSFGVRLSEAMRTHGPLCVGIDPHAAVLAAWDLPDSLEGLARFADTCVEAFGGHVAAVKPQAAFFERFGSAGVAVLEQTLEGLREAGTLSIVDVKRGDIGSTMAGYAEAYLGDDSPLRSDAMTVSPFLGYESLRPALDLAEKNGRGVFVLALTSNPEGAAVQHARVTTGADEASHSVAGSIVAGATHDNSEALSRNELGSVGLVVGATVGEAISRLGLDLAAANAPLLAPGVGAQGATAADLRTVFGHARPTVLASSSRGVLAVGPSVEKLRARAVATAADLVKTLEL